MYNGIGLQTARGTGTNGYVQSNLSHLLLSRRRVEYNAEEDIARAEAALNRRPNEELLDHQRKRQIELKCTEFEMLMENKGFEQEDIDKKVSDYRRLLLSQLESGELNVDDEICLKDSHARQKYAAQKRAQWKEALRIDKDFKPGSSMQNMNKEGGEEDAAALAEKAKAEEEAARLKKLVKIARKEQKKKEKEAKRKRKEKKKKQAAKRRKRDVSSSSSSSSSSDSDSDSSDSSDSDSSESDSSASSSDSDREERKRRKAKAKKLIKKTSEKERAREVKKETESDEEDKRGGRGRDKRDERERRDDRRREDDRRRPAREDSRERRRNRNSSSERDQRRRNRSDSNEEKGRRKEAGKDKEIKQEPISDSEVPVRQEPRRSSSRSASPYIDSDVSDDTRRRMKSMVTVVKK